MTLHELAKYVDDINTLNGFDKPTWENLPVKVMMVVTEVDELENSLNYHPKSEAAKELADVAIRLMSLLHSVWGDKWELRQRNFGSFAFQHVPAVVLWPLLKLLCSSVELWRNDDRRGTEYSLGKALSEVFGLAKYWKFDLEKEIKLKADFNKERGYLHGKVRSEG